MNNCVSIRWIEHPHEHFGVDRVSLLEQNGGFFRFVSEQRAVRMSLDTHMDFGGDLRRNERLGFALVVRLGDDFVAVVLHLEFESEVTNSN